MHVKPYFQFQLIGDREELQKKVFFLITDWTTGVVYDVKKTHKRKQTKTNKQNNNNN